MFKFVSVVSAALAGATTMLMLSTSAMALAPDGVTLNVMAGPAPEMRWTPTGTAVRDIPLCITSETGTFVLDVATQGATSGDDQKLNFLFTDPEGGTDAATAPLGGRVTLQGVVDQSEDCRAGANARLRISLDRADVLAGVAGDLSIMMNFTARAR